MTTPSYLRNPNPLVVKKLHNARVALYNLVDYFRVVHQCKEFDGLHDFPLEVRRMWAMRDTTCHPRCNPDEFKFDEQGNVVLSVRLTGPAFDECDFRDMMSDRERLIAWAREFTEDMRTYEKENLKGLAVFMQRTIPDLDQDRDLRAIRLSCARGETTFDEVFSNLGKYICATFCFPKA